LILHYPAPYASVRRAPVRILILRSRNTVHIEINLHHPFPGCHVNNPNTSRHVMVGAGPPFVRHALLHLYVMLALPIGSHSHIRASHPASIESCTCMDPPGSRPVPRELQRYPPWPLPQKTPLDTHPIAQPVTPDAARSSVVHLRSLRFGLLDEAALRREGACRLFRGAGAAPGSRRAERRGRRRRRVGRVGRSAVVEVTPRAC